MSLFLIFIMIFLTYAYKNNPVDGGDSVVVPIISIASMDMLEGNGTNSEFEFEVTLSASTTKEVSVNFTTQEGTAVAGDDYITTSGTLTFEPGDTLERIIVEVIGDTVDEDQEQFIVKLSNAVNATLSVSQAIGRITNDEGIDIDPTDGYSTPLSYDGMELVWHEEFLEPNINPNYFTHEFGNHGWGNNEEQNYGNSPANSYIEDGKLVISANREDDGGYTSARIVTRDKFEFVFGRVDIRAKVPGTQGIWPALWMLGSDIQDIGWPACGEIDIMELVGHNHNKVHGTAHYGNQGIGHSIHQGEDIALPEGETFLDEFHVFSIIWEPNSIKWYMDDLQFFELNIADVGSETWRFNHDHFFIFNIAVGGNWPGYPDTTTVFPAKMSIDYIRVFQ